MSGDESKGEWKTPERDDRPVSGRFVSAVIAGALLLFTLFVVASGLQLRARERHLNPAGPTTPAVLGQAEINIVNTGLIVLDTRAEEERNQQRERLHGYGWVERDAGVVHIPIERAIERVLSGPRRDGGGP